MSAYNFLSNEFHITVNHEAKTLTVTDIKWGGIFSSNNRYRNTEASELIFAFGEGLYDTTEVVNDDVLYKVEFTTNVRVELRDIAREEEEFETVDSDENGDDVESEYDYMGAYDALAEEEDAEEDDGNEGTWFELNSVGCEYFASHMDEGFVTTRAILRAAHGGECDITFGEAGFQVFTTDYMGNQVHIGDIVELPAFIDAPAPNVPPTSDRDDFSDWVKNPRSTGKLAELNEDIPYVLCHNDSGYQDEADATPPRWVATWVMDGWVETHTFRAHLDGGAPGYPTEATAIALMAGDEPPAIENSAGGEDRWTLQTLNLAQCHFENGNWYAN